MNFFYQINLQNINKGNQNKIFTSNTYFDIFYQELLIKY